MCNFLKTIKQKINSKEELEPLKVDISYNTSYTEETEKGLFLVLKVLFSNNKQCRYNVKISFSDSVKHVDSIKYTAPKNIHNISGPKIFPLAPISVKSTITTNLIIEANSEREETIVLQVNGNDKEWVMHIDCCNYQKDLVIDKRLLNN